MRNGKITLLFTDEDKSWSGREFLTSQICLLAPIVKICEFTVPIQPSCSKNIKQFKIIDNDDDYVKHKDIFDGTVRAFLAHVEYKSQWRTLTSYLNRDFCPLTHLQLMHINKLNCKNCKLIALLLYIKLQNYVSYEKIVNSPGCLSTQL